MLDTVDVIPKAPWGGRQLAFFAGILFTLITRIRDLFYVLLQAAPGHQLSAASAPLKSGEHRAGSQGLVAHHVLLCVLWQMVSPLWSQMCEMRGQE